MTRAAVRLHNLASRIRVDSPYRIVAVLVGLALLVRVAWVIFAHSDALVGDPAAYVWYGNRLSCGRGYDSHAAFLEQVARLPAAQRPAGRFSACDPVGPLPPSAFYAIGYPIFLAILFAPARWLGLNPSDQDLLYGLAHSLLGAATVYLVWLIARRLFSARVAILAASIMALWPNLLMMTATAHLETLYLFLLLAGVAVLVAVVESPMPPRTPRLVAAGALLGAAGAVRPLVVLILPALLGALVSKPQPWRAAFRHTTILSVTMLAFVLPWTVRNAIAMPGIVAVTTGTGDALCISRFEGASGRFEFNSPGCMHSLPGAEWDELEVKKNAENTARAFNWVIDHPTSEMRMWLRRGYYAFRDDHEARLALEAPGADPLWSDSQRAIADRVADLWYWSVMGLAVVGLTKLGRDKRGGTRLIIGAALSAFVVPFVLFGDPRYKVPMLPFLALIAAVGIERILIRLSR